MYIVPKKFDKKYSGGSKREGILGTLFLVSIGVLIWSLLALDFYYIIGCSFLLMVISFLLGGDDDTHPPGPIIY